MLTVHHDLHVHIHVAHVHNTIHVAYQHWCAAVWGYLFRPLPIFGYKKPGVKGHKFGRGVHFSGMHLITGFYGSCLKCSVHLQQSTTWKCNDVASIMMRVCGHRYSQAFVHVCVCVLREWL